MTSLGTAFRLLRAERVRIKPDPAQVTLLRARLEAGGRLRTGRSLALVHVETGCCGACAAALDELRLGPLAGGSHGLAFVERPNEAEVLLVTGLAVRNAAAVLTRTWQAMGRGAIAVAIGDCAAGADPTGRPAPYAATDGGVAGLLPIDLAIRGAPPTPDSILLGLITLRDAAERPKTRRTPRPDRASVEPRA